jgi:hypothetical protein
MAVGPPPSLQIKPLARVCAPGLTAGVCHGRDSGRPRIRGPGEAVAASRINARVKRTGFPAILLQQQPQRLARTAVQRLGFNPARAISPTGEDQCSTPATLTDDDRLSVRRG